MLRAVTAGRLMERAVKSKRRRRRRGEAHFIMLRERMTFAYLLAIVRPPLLFWCRAAGRQGGVGVEVLEWRCWKREVLLPVRSARPLETEMR